MRTVVLDCAQMTSREAAHDYLARELSFPDWYGRNLDALYDLLSTCPELNLTLTNAAAIAKLFRYGDNLMLTLRDAAEANPNFTLEIQE